MINKSENKTKVIKEATKLCYITHFTSTATGRTDGSMECKCTVM
jgi:hypothetical protein